MVRGPSLEVTESGLRLPVYDYVSNATASTSDTYTFRIGGSGGLVVCVVALTFTDSSKETLSTVTRTPPL